MITWLVKSIFLLADSLECFRIGGSFVLVVETERPEIQVDQS